MSATAPPSLKWIGAVGVGAVVLFILGAVVVEPAVHRVIEPADDPAPHRPSGRVEVGDAVLDGRYAAAGSTLVVEIEGSALSTDTGGTLTSEPHRLVPADQHASVSTIFADAMTVPPQAQIEIRRVTAEEDTRLCAGHPVGWLALAVRRDGFVMMPVRQGPPPGALTTNDRLCAVLDLSR
ncbi:hypothetical protein [Brevundimonas sp. 'scallop']|uniref:hypothetical protein n=1 Tax=Brevundimonas sp. 'scallop' TaxID=2562582 RepID=UPI0013E1F93E|nr:hypothetical protein [Brevundimonas sp. 'scallop']QIF80562.1 hypothetical protein E4341_02060 [Brevundimonas sp. 'scallop']